MRHLVLVCLLLGSCLPVVAHAEPTTFTIRNGSARAGATTFTPARPAATPARSTAGSAPAATGATPPQAQSSDRYQQVYYGDETYMNAYRRVIRTYNPSLGPADLDTIVRSILYYSYLQRVDPRFVVAVVAQESRFRTNALSSCGAQGLGQLMPGTAASLGVDPTVPYQNIQGTVRYLKLMLSRFTHLDRVTQMKFALASYNAGYGAVTKYGGIPPYAETQAYVRVVMSEFRRLSGER